MSNLLREFLFRLAASLNQDERRYSRTLNEQLPGMEAAYSLSSVFLPTQISRLEYSQGDHIALTRFRLPRYFLVFRSILTLAMPQREMRRSYTYSWEISARSASVSSFL